MVFLAWFVTFCVLGYVLNESRFYDRKGALKVVDLQSWLSSKLKIALAAFGFALALAVIDTLGQTVYAFWQAPESSPGTWLAAWWGWLVAVFAGARQFVAYFAGKTAGVQVRLPVRVSSTIAALLIYTATLTSVNALSHGVAWGFQVPNAAPKNLLAAPAPSLEESVDGIRAGIENLESSLQTDANRTGSTQTFSTQDCARRSPACFEPVTLQCGDCVQPGSRTWIVTLLAFVFLCALSRGFGVNCPFLNNSTVLPLYTARLTRAYLGASNPARVVPDTDGPTPLSVTKVHEHDDMPPDLDNTAQGESFAKGAPLHLINVTINETLEGRSRLEHRDRQGIGMAVGPAGISAGFRHHVVHLDAVRHIASVFPKPDDPLARPFRMFEYEAVKSRSDQPRVRYSGEALSSGQWAAISGAAFSTGLGARTSVGLSLLAGFFNVRLGYWWNSGVDPDDRSAAGPRSGFGAWLDESLARAFPVQSHLLDEFLARFRGAARRHWYLTDGGHFENLGAYELIRRRLPLIVIVDAEADGDYAYDGLANLTRKARLDFDAEIEFFDENTLRVLKSNGLTTLEHFGTLDMLRRGPWSEEPVPSTDGNMRATRPVFGPPDRPKRSLAHAALAAVRYEGRRNPESLIVYVKPTLVGDEPADVAQYHAANPDFPHQATIDQFFDEAQWESYRKLGQFIAERVFKNGFRPYLDVFG